jgi:hypothetical protein
MVAQSGISARLTGILPSLGARSSVVEHLTFNQGVDGSIPSGLTIIFKSLRSSLSTRSMPRAHAVHTRGESCRRETASRSA